MFTASSSRALSARAAVVERLRRVLFSPQRLLTAGTLACVLAFGGSNVEAQMINERGPGDHYYINYYPWLPVQINGGTLHFNGNYPLETEYTYNWETSEWEETLQNGEFTTVTDADGNPQLKFVGKDGNEITVDTDAQKIFVTFDKDAFSFGPQGGEITTDHTQKYFYYEYTEDENGGKTPKVYDAIPTDEDQNSYKVVCLKAKTEVEAGVTYYLDAEGQRIDTNEENWQDKIVWVKEGLTATQLHENFLEYEAIAAEADNPAIDQYKVCYLKSTGRYESAPDDEDRAIIIDGKNFDYMQDFFPEYKDDPSFKEYANIALGNTVLVLDAEISSQDAGSAITKSGKGEVHLGKWGSAYNHEFQNLTVNDGKINIYGETITVLGDIRIENTNRDAKGNPIVEERPELRFGISSSASEYTTTIQNLYNGTANAEYARIQNENGEICEKPTSELTDEEKAQVLYTYFKLDPSLKLEKEGGFARFDSNVDLLGKYISVGKNTLYDDARNTSASTDTFWGDLTMHDGSRFISFGAYFGTPTNISGATIPSTTTLQSGSQAWIIGDSLWQDVHEDVADGKVVWQNGAATNLVVEKDGVLNTQGKNVSNISQITVDEGGLIRFRNYDQAFANGDLEINGDGVLYTTWSSQFAGQSVEDYRNQMEQTTNELGEVTALYRDNTYKAITAEQSKNNGWKDGIFSSPLSGKGTIEISALAYKTTDNKLQGADFFTIFTGDQSQFQGDTRVDFGALVLLSSSYNDQQYIESGYAKSEEYTQYQAALNAWKIAYQEWEANGKIGDEPAQPKSPGTVSRDMVQQVYGSATKEGEFAVRGQSFLSYVTADWDTVGTNGRVAFWRNTFNGDLEKSDDPNSAYQKSLLSAPTLNADTILFESSYVYRDEDKGWGYDHAANDLGAQIVFNTTFKYNDANGEEQIDNTSARTLATLNANEIAFSESNYVWYDGISQLDESAKLTINLNAPTIKVHTNDSGDGSDFYGNYYLVDADNTDALQAVFDKPLVNAQVDHYLKPGLVKKVDDAGNVVLDENGEVVYEMKDLDAYEVTVNARNVADFAANEGKMAQAEIDYAKKLDVARKGSDANVRFNDALYNENDAAKVRQTIHNLSLLGHQMLNQHSHVGNPTSAFFGGASLSASTKRGQDAQNDAPLADLPQESAINNNEKEQEEYNPTRGLWASFTHTNVDGDTYQDRGMTMHGYDLRRSGVIGGMKRQYDATLSGGLFFGLTLPEIESNAANANSGASVYSKMEMTDFQFAGHLEKIIADNWELCLFVGGGHQSMDWERTVNQKYQYTADSTGNTLTGTAYLAYRIDMNDRWTIRPTVGLDSEHSWLYNFTETGGELGSLAELGYANQMLAQRYRYEDTYYNRNLARVGFTTAFDGAQGWAGLNARAFYSTQLGGKPSALLTYRTVGDVNDANYLDLNFEDMGSHVMGSDAFSVGGGGYMHLNKTKTLTANGDINAIWYKNASTLNVTGGVSYRF